MIESNSTPEPTEEEKQAIFDWVDSVNDADTESIIKKMEEKFPRHVIDWFNETMLLLVVDENDT